jgi:uncharacterized protein (TIGR02145 family)
MFHGVFTQDISNINQSIEDGRIRITFDLHGENYLCYDIIITAEKGNHIIQPTAVAGDISYVSPGTKKLIWWEPTLDGRTLKGWNVKINSTKGRILDIDRNEYKSVLIGKQVWMAENLKVTHYRNGDPILTGYDNYTWSKLDLNLTAAFAVYEDNISYAATYGNLYNWYTIGDNRDICPEGWHVPTDSEWKELTEYIGGEAIGGGRLKEIGLEHWKDPNKVATSETNFNALPGGYCYFNNGLFYDIGIKCYFWSSTANNSNHAWCWKLSYKSSEILRSNYKKRSGLSVRCIMD